MNKVTEKYFTHKNFALFAKKALREVAKQTSFTTGKEIYRGHILDKNKVGSIIYSGIFQDCPAALKLQGLRPEIEEVKIIEAFNKQNKSKFIRLPEIYFYKSWSKRKGYGYTISEFVVGTKIYGWPLASKAEMKRFATFYQELRAHALKCPFIKTQRISTLNFCLNRLHTWQRICEYKKYIKFSDYAPYVSKYSRLVVKFLSKIKIIFSHGHLSPDDIIVTKKREFVLLSNLFWGYRPQWYDLAFNIYTRLQQLRDTTFKVKQLVKYIEDWIKIYKTIPVVKKDKNFDWKIRILLLERSLGAILVDVGSNEELAKDKRLLRYFIKVHQRIFTHLYQQLSKKMTYEPK